MGRSVKIIVAVVTVAMLCSACAYRKWAISVAPIESRSDFVNRLSGELDVPPEAVLAAISEGMAVGDVSEADMEKIRAALDNNAGVDEVFITGGGSTVYSSAVGKSTDLTVYFNITKEGDIDGFAVEDGEVFKNVFGSIFDGIAGIVSAGKTAVHDSFGKIKGVYNKAEDAADATEVK